jgi:signal transduction histidine kinase
LGYIIIASIMELLGGGFKVTSSRWEGTTVVLHLPLK